MRLLVCGRMDPSVVLDKDWIIYRGMVPHDQIPLYLGASDLLAIPYRESAIMEMGASCKIVEYLMSGRPIVTTSTGNFISNFPVQARELGPGCCPPGDVEALAGSLRRQLQEQRIPSAPMGMSWTEVAAGALSEMRGLSAGSK